MRSDKRIGDWAAVIVNFNSAVFLDGCLSAIFKGELPPAEVVVVDNASTDDSLQELTGWPQVVVETSTENLGFAGGANRGISLTEAPIVVVLNPDVDLDPTFGSALVSLFDAHDRLGAAGPKLRFPDGQIIQHAGGELNSPLLTTQHRGYQMPDNEELNVPADVDFVTGGAMALRRATFAAAGGFDERFWPAYYEDVDLCLRLRKKGWQVRYEPSLTAVHIESVGLGRSIEYYRLFHRNRLRFALKHLSASEWTDQFVPAEIERLRGELQVVTDADWPTRSGAEAIEEFARAGTTRRLKTAGVVAGGPLTQAIAMLAETRLARAELAEAITDTSRGRAPTLLRTGLARLTSGEFIWRQQALNDTVIRLLDAQDWLNRESIAQSLLLLLDLIGRVEYGARRD